MFISYTMSVLLLAFALYGMVCFGQDAWQWWQRGMRPAADVTLSFLCCFTADEDEAAGFLENLLQSAGDKLEQLDIVVVLDREHAYLAKQVQRLAEDGLPIHLVSAAAGEAAQPGLFLPYCRGAAVHVLQIGNRLSLMEASGLAAALLECQWPG